eukprot:536301_1
MTMVALEAHTPVVVLRSIFKQFDDDGNGTLDKQEFNELLSSIGINNQEHKEACALLADENADGVVSEKEFIDWVQKDEIMDIIMDSEKFHTLQKVCAKFKSVDIDGDKTITWNEFKTFFVDDDDTFDLETAQMFWDEIDVNGDGEITFKEYFNHNKKWAPEFMKNKKPKPRRLSSNKFNVDPKILKNVSANNTIPPFSPIEEANTAEEQMEYSEQQLEEMENNIMEQLMAFGYDENDITDAMYEVDDKYNMNQIKMYLDKNKSGYVEQEQIQVQQKEEVQEVYEEIEENNDDNEEVEEKQQDYISIDEAKNMKGNDRENLISDGDFEKVFGMSRDKFNAMKGWKKKQLKQKTGFW